MGTSFSCCQNEAIGPALDDRFSGKRVLITGATSGLGLLLAKRLAGSGANVVGWGRNESAMDRIQSEASERGWQLRMMKCDVGSKDEIAKSANQVLALLGGVDILVNNAGVSSGGKWITDLSDKEITQSLHVNLMAHFWTVRAFLPYMIQQDSGHIVTVSSVAGIMGVAGLSDYCASKFGAFGLTESLRFELSKIDSKVCTTIVCPSYIDNSMGKEAEVKCATLFPLMNEEYVVQRIMAAIVRKQALIILPSTIKSTYLARMYPVSWYDRIVKTWANV